MIKAIVTFYQDGFRNMRLGRTLWKIILLKLLIMFAFLKLFFFPDVLQVSYDNDIDRAEHVLQHLTKNNATTDDEMPRQDSFK